MSLHSPWYVCSRVKADIDRPQTREKEIAGDLRERLHHAEQVFCHNNTYAVVFA